MKKNGFTLVELIVSITLLSLIGITVGVYLNKISGSTENSEYNTFVNKVKSSASVYLAGNNDVLNQLQTNKAFVILTMGELEKSGLLQEGIQNPKGTTTDTEIKISLDAEGAIVIEYPFTRVNEYLSIKDIKLELNGSNDYNCFTGINTLDLGLIKDDGSLNSGYFVSNGSGYDKISCDKEINTIDTNEMGTYKINYTYIDSKGTKKNAVRNVMVVDSVAPILGDIVLINPTSSSVWTSSDVTYKFVAKDVHSGIASYCIAKGNKWEDCDSKTKVNIKADTEYEIKGTASSKGTYVIKVTDKYGNSIGKVFDINNIDKEAPSFEGVSNDCSVTKTSCHITGTIKEDGSGLASATNNMSASVPSWPTVTPSKNINYEVTKNGTYYLWAKDNVGLYANKQVVISAFDETGPEITGYTSNQGSSYSSSFTLSGYIEDTQTGIAGYQFTTNSSTPTSGWTSITNTTSKKYVSQSISSNGTYYLWAKDAMGNTTRSSAISITKKASLLSTTVSGSGLSSSSVSSSKYISGVKEVVNYSSNTGSISNAYVSGSYIYYSGSASSYSASATCQTSASSYLYCRSPYCPSSKGGSLSGTTCTGSEKVVNNYTCSCNLQKTTDATTGSCSSYNTDCSQYGSNYSRDYSTWLYYTTTDGGVYLSDTGATGLCRQLVAYAGGWAGTRAISAKGRCTWNGNYSAYCGSSGCGSDTQVGSYCYSCSSGYYNSSSGYCNYSCNVTRYEYNYTITYWG